NGARFASEPVVADLNNDGFPEVIFTTYETVAGKGAIVVLDRFGKKVAQTPLPGRGAMAAPTLADIYRTGELEVVVNLKDATPQGGIQIYDLPGSKTNQILWPTGRGNNLRNGDATR
ncbi:MAG TPA: VCBS repeat-containing protein, partial [Candidatus Manganitrophaceae bacterium]|nr:VCBS repeat-containing protein [Candidatus Manganitrophaceae bacterium]